MRDKIKHNIGLKIMAALFAVFLWWAVVNIDDPLDSKTYDVTVRVTNAEVITNEGKSFKVSEDTQTVSVTVKARRKLLSEIETKDIVATADMRERQDSSVPIRIRINGYEGRYEEVTANPRNIQVKVENTLKKTFPITAVATGTPREGYVVGSMTVSPKTVDISGPESIIAKISKVAAKVDVSELAKDETLHTQLVYYDAADNVIDQSRLSSNCDKNGVSVSVEIWKTRSVILSFDTSEIKVANGYVFKGIEVEPKMVEISGKTEVLNAIAMISVGPEVLKRTDISANEEVVIELTEHLPDGIVLVDANAASVVVRIMIEKAGTKTIALPVRSVAVQNASEDFQLEYGPAQEVSLTFAGSEEVLKGLDEEQITASIDLLPYTEEGTYKVTIKISKLPEGCSYIGDATVEITLTRK